MSLKLVLATFIETDTLSQALENALADRPFEVHWGKSKVDFGTWVANHRHQIDCLMVGSSDAAMESLRYLKEAGILLPALIMASEERPTAKRLDEIYHPATIVIPRDCLDQIETYTDQAIRQFLELPPHQTEAIPGLKPSHGMLLRSRQQRLTDKLKERLGYLGIYYKRNSDQFLRNMSQSERKELLTQLARDYRAIILKYFSEEADLNDRIDDFVNIAFFADVSVSQLVEIHMNLMDEFAKQLKLEGRSEEILLDYRLTLIDVISHLCEMYRRSIPRES
ncbi:circadian clock protein KaiA [filamentous cyanobacterium CCP5]|nr:circadian clock protein KaiA [filamentous cyanobacterium CCP5]